ncbi:MAG: OmpA family protein [Bacteroidota bacterium]|nr:OmpA family protein [Bacteroidota bacterium]
MKKLLLLCLAAQGLVQLCMAQDNDYIKRPALGVHFFFDDFNGGGYVKKFGLNRAIRDKQIGKFSSMSPGLAINYLKGISPHLDLSAGLAGSFVDYPITGKSAFGNDNLLLEGDVSVSAKMLTDKYWVTPYLSAGLGASKYKGYYGAIVPLGVGLQVNFYDEAYLFINSQYRFGLTENTSNHLYYSIGVAGNIGAKKEPKPLAVAPPPIPVAEPPKDRDNDGVVDSLDACPDTPGMAKFNGCPDTDNDGIPDKDDKCPSIAGLARYQGCPVPDRDKDGINDEEDKCPDQPGVARYQGCPVPDRDKDGVNDEEDKCPDLAGDPANGGCPVIKEEVVRKIEYAAKNIFFASGKYTLLAKSNKGLNEVVKILNENKDLKLDIDGYTDNTGKAEKNQVLSQNRADAVMKYFVSKGVDASRLQSTGHGVDSPIADNKTAAGRAKNRRVELHLKYY